MNKLTFITDRFYHATKPQKIECTLITEDSNINYVIFNDTVRHIKGKLYGCPLDKTEIMRRYDSGNYEPA